MLPNLLPFQLLRVVVPECLSNQGQFRRVLAEHIPLVLNRSFKKFYLMASFPSDKLQGRTDRIYEL